MIKKQLKEHLEKFRYESKRGLGKRGLMKHHIDALTDYLYPLINSEKTQEPCYYCSPVGDSWKIENYCSKCGRKFDEEVD